jgi:hypothetical protein
MPYLHSPVVRFCFVLGIPQLVLVLQDCKFALLLDRREFVFERFDLGA